MILFNNLVCRSSKATSAEFSVGYEDFILRVEPTAPGVFRIQCGSAQQFEYRKSNQRAGQRLKLLLAREEVIGEMQMIQTKDAWIFTQSGARLEIGKNPFSLKFYKLSLNQSYAQESATDLSEQGLGHKASANDRNLNLNHQAHQNKQHDQEAQTELVLQTDDSYDEVFAFEDNWALMLRLGATEAVYGLGTTEGNFDRRTEELVSDDPAFRYLPLAWSRRGWGLYINSLHRSQHSVGTQDDPNTYQLRCYDKLFDIFFLVAEPVEIFNQYTMLTGRCGQPDLASMGIWLKQVYGQTEQEFLNLAEQLRGYGIPVDTLSYTWPAMIQFQHNRLALEWDNQRVGDCPRSFFSQLQSSGWHAAIPTFPGIVADTPLFDELEDRGWLLTNQQGLAQRFDGVPATNGAQYGLLDLSYKNALNFWQERHQQLLEHNQAVISQVKNINFPQQFSGSHADEDNSLRTLYPMLLEQSLFNALSARTTPPDAVVVRDYAGAASQRVPWLQAQNYANTWQGLRQLYRALLSTQLSGMPLIIHDLGNAEDAALSPELYLRYLALSIFSTNFALHADPKLLPVAYDDVTQTIAIQWLRLRYRLVPYVLGVIDESARTGLPVQRTMALAFVADSLAAQFDEQFMFGPALLVAPVLQEGNRKTVYLPAGEVWWDLSSGIRYEGGVVLEYTCEVDGMIVFGREGHMLSIGADLNHLGELNSSHLLEEIWMFGLPQHNPVVMRNKIRVMQMQGSSYIRGLEGIRILHSEGLEVKRRGPEVRISPAR